MGEEKRRTGRRLLPDEVLEAEIGYIEKRREAAGVERSRPKEDLVGLALSGGGIRSATFSMGAIQSLMENGVFKYVDYLSTVSGGGYMGSCLTSLTTIREPEEQTEEEEKERIRAGNRFKRHESQIGGPLHSASQVHHLRTHGDFLVARRGLFRRDVLRAIGSTTLGFLCTFVMFALAIFVLVGVLFTVGSWLGGEEMWRIVEVRGASAVWRHLPPNWSAWIWIPSVAALGGFVAAAVAYRRRLWKPEKEATPDETADDREGRRGVESYFSVLGIGILLMLIVAWVLWRESPGRGGSLLLLAPVMALGAVLGATIYFIACAWHFKTRSEKFPWTIEFRSTVGAMRAVGFLMLVGCLTIPASILLVAWLEEGGFEVLVTGLASLVSSRLFITRRMKPTDPASMKSKASGLLSRLILQIAVPVLILCGVVGGALVFLSMVATQPWVGPVILVAAFTLFYLLGWAIDFNRISLHYFYRDRLSEAYLRTEGLPLPESAEMRTGCGVDRKSDLGVLRDDRSLRLGELHDWAVEGENNRHPYHLVTCSLNLPGSRNLVRKDQKSDHFLFSREYVGSCTTGFVPTRRYCDGRIKLSAAMTISGAAVSSVMGYHTGFTPAFAATLFNVRLGFWIPNPREYLDESEEREPHLRRVFWPKLLWRELTALTSARDFMVNLSDGGHTGDNLGIKHLLQRRVRTIIVVDGERDPDYQFGSLSAAFRQAFAEENVVVDFDIDAIRPARDEDERRGKLARAHHAIGRIRYPDDGKGNGPATGTLIVLKSSYRDEEEPAGVKTYAANNPEFPHQSTLDQFFDDEQFEAYRALGQHVADCAMPLIREAVEPPLPPPPEEPWTSEPHLRDALERHGGSVKAVAEEFGTSVGKVRYQKSKFKL